MTVTADFARFAEVEETQYGVTPTTPVLELIRLTGEGINYTPTTATSANLNPKRAVEDSFLTGGSASGPINFELASEKWFEDLLAGAMCNEWTTDALKVGTLLKSFTIEKTFPLDPTTNDYHRVPGSIVNGFSLTIAPNAAITGAFDMLAKDYLVDADVVTGATYQDPQFNPIFTAPLVTDIEISGIAATGKCFNNITLTLANNARAIECIGSLGAREMNLGTATVTLAFSLYYSDSDMLDMLKQQTEFSVAFTVNDNDTPPHSYTFELPRAKLTQCNIVAGGTGQDVMADCVATGLLDATDDTPLTITRGLAALALVAEPLEMIEEPEAETL